MAASSKIGMSNIGCVSISSGFLIKRSVWHQKHMLHFSPPARWRLLDFMSACPPPPLPSFLLLSARVLLFLPSSSSSSPDLICQLLIAVGLAGSQLPALDRSGPRRTSSPSSWSQWASPDLHCQLSIAVDLNRRESVTRRDSERCGPRRTSTARKNVRKNARLDRMSDIISDKDVR